LRDHFSLLRSVLRFAGGGLDSVTHIRADGERGGPTAETAADQTSIDHNILAGDEGGSVAGEKYGGAGYVIGGARAGDWLQAGEYTGHRIGDPFGLSAFEAGALAEYACHDCSG